MKRYWLDALMVLSMWTILFIGLALSEIALIVSGLVAAVITAALFGLVQLGVWFDRRIR